MLASLRCFREPDFIRYSGDLSGEIANWPDLEDSYASEGEETSYTDETNPEGRRFYVIEEL